MVRPLKIVASAILLLTILALAIVCVFYENMPWVGQRFSYSDLGQPYRWSLSLELQQGRVLGSSGSTLAQVPAPDHRASLKATLVQKGQRTGQEWLETFRVESVEAIQYSWDQPSNKDLMSSQWEARIGPLGGLRRLEVKPQGHSLWTREEIATTTLLSLWPQFLPRGIEPKQSWTTQVPFRMTARELLNPINARWDCSWSFRGNPPSDVPLASFDLAAHATSSEQPLEGILRAEVLYSMVDRLIGASRGSFQIKVAASTQATADSAITVMECLQGQFLLQRLIDQPSQVKR